MFQGFLLCNKCGYSYYRKPVSKTAANGKNAAIFITGILALIHGVLVDSVAALTSKSGLTF